MSNIHITISLTNLLQLSSIPSANIILQLHQHMNTPLKITRLSSLHSSKYQYNSRSNNVQIKQQGLQKVLNIFSTLDFHGIRQINVDQLKLVLAQCQSIGQFLDRLVRTVIEVKDRQQINCQYINTRMQKQIEAMQEKIQKQENIITTLGLCYEESKKHYESIMAATQAQINDIVNQNQTLKNKIKQLQSKKEKEVNSSAENLLFNLKKDDNYLEKQQNYRRKLRDYQQIGDYGGVYLKNKNKNLQNVQYQFDSPVQSSRKKKESLMGASDEDLLAEINQLRQNQKQLLQKLEQKQKIIRELLELAGMSE